MKLLTPPEIARNPDFTTPPIASLIPLAGVRDNCYLLTDGSLVAVYQVTGPVYEMAGDDEMNRFVLNLAGVLNVMPSGMACKVIHRIHHNWLDVIESHEAKQDGKEPFPRYVAWTRSKAIRAKMKRGELLRNENLICFTFNPSKQWWQSRDKLALIKETLSTAMDAGPVVRRTQSRFQQILSEFEALLRTLVNTMELGDMRPERLDSLALYQLAWELLNPDISLKRGCPTIRVPTSDHLSSESFGTTKGAKRARKNPALTVVAPITEREQLAQSDLRVEEDHVVLGSRRIAALVMTMLPMTVYRTMALTLAQLPFPCSIVMDATMLSKADELRRQLNSSRMQEAVAGMKLFANEKGDPAEAAKAAESEERYLKLLSANQNPFQVRMTILVEGADARELDDRCDDVTTRLRTDMDGLEARRERYGVHEILRLSWPFSMVSDYSARKAMTSEVAALLPVFDRWEGSRLPVALVMDRMGRLVKHDPFPEQAGNKNVIVVGTTGSGKSFATQLLKMQPFMTRDNAEVLIMESGASFKYTVECFGGTHLALGPGCPYQFNAFDLPADFKSRTPDEQKAVMQYKIPFLVRFILALTRQQDPTVHLTATSVLGECIQDAYDKHDPPLLRHVHQALHHYKNPDDQDAVVLAGRLRTLLAPYVHRDEEGRQAGPYAAYMDLHSNFDVEGKILAFDLMAVKDDDALLEPLALLTIGGIFHNRLLRRDGKNRLIVFDEAWALIKNRRDGTPSMAGEAIEMFWREIRKLGGGGLMISQSIDDVANDGVGRKILQNTAMMSVLKHQSDQATTAAFQQSGFNERRIELAYSLKTMKGHYSEMLLREDSEWGVVRLPSEGIPYWLATTDPPDLRKRNEYQARYGDSWGISTQAITALLAENFPLGVAFGGGRPEMTEAEALLFAERWREHYERFQALVAAGKPIPADFS